MSILSFLIGYLFGYLMVNQNKVAEFIIKIENKIANFLIKCRK